MEKIIEVTGNIAAVAGVLICLIAGMYRLFGYYTVSNLIQVEPLFLLGMGLMIFAILTKLHLFTMRK